MMMMMMVFISSQEKKSGGNAAVDSDVALASNFIQNTVVCRSVENILNAEYSIWQTEILRDDGLKLCETLFVNATRRRRLTMQQFVLQYVQGALVLE